MKIFFTKLGLILTGVLKISVHKQARSQRGKERRGGAGWGLGGEDTPLPDINKFILPSTENMSF